jgi:hypothetical protein
VGSAAQRDALAGSVLELSQKVADLETQNTRLMQEARRFYLADGSYIELDPAEVVARRKAAAVENTRLRQELRASAMLARGNIDCWREAKEENTRLHAALATTHKRIEEATAAEQRTRAENTRLIGWNLRASKLLTEAVKAAEDGKTHAGLCKGRETQRRDDTCWRLDAEALLRESAPAADNAANRQLAIGEHRPGCNAIVACGGAACSCGAVQAGTP